MKDHTAAPTATVPPPAPAEQRRPPEPDQRPKILAGRQRALLQTIAFLRKETLAILLQPRLLIVLVIGPFLLLFLFGLGYDQQATILRTAFVGPPDSIFEESVAEFGDDLEEFVEPMGYTANVLEAQRWLENDEIDLIVIFPADPAETIMGNNQAIIDVLHNKLDPIQQTAVNISAQVAVQELNARVLEQIVGDLQQSVAPYRETAEQSATLLDELDDAVARSDAEETERLTAQLEQNAAGLESVVSLTGAVRNTLGADLDEESSQQLDQALVAIESFQTTTVELADDPENINEADVDLARTALDDVVAESETIVTLDPAIAVRPFRTDAENLLRETVTLDQFFAPSAIALLLQHMALTFAALGVVRDRSLGLFELFRVGPIGPGRILVGKYLSTLLISGAVAAALLFAVHRLINVPLRGEVYWIAIGVVGLITASIAAGMVVSLLSRTDSQAVQYAMLVLLAGLFFGGFLLDIDTLTFPVKALSYVLPVTFGTNLLRDVMLRGVEPAELDLIGLAATSVVYGLIAWALMARKLRLGAA